MPVIILSGIGTLFCAGGTAGLLTYTKELFPTPLRTTALGTASAAGRLGVLTSPFIAMLGSENSVLPIIIYGMVVLAAAVVSLWLWPETNRRQMTETIEEAEKVASTQNQWLKCCTSNPDNSEMK